jgi:hypothetical protein
MRIVRETGNKYTVYQTVKYNLTVEVEEPAFVIWQEHRGDWRKSKVLFNGDVPACEPYCDGPDSQCYSSLAAAVDSLQ